MPIVDHEQQRGPDFRNPVVPVDVLEAVRFGALWHLESLRCIGARVDVLAEPVSL